MIQIPDNTLFILNTLENAGFDAYVVGGCVRDSLLGKKPYDWDVATNALPEEIKKTFSGIKTVDTGLKHGTVTVVYEGKNTEITTFRIDGEYSDSRHPDSVCFTEKLAADLARRDFTVNAMAYNEKDGIIDLFGGQKDLENRIIRCVGEPDKRFSEDALRILRGLRFASVLSFSLEENTAASIIKNEKLLEDISVERIGSELLKLLTGVNVFSVLSKYKSVFGVFIPELKDEFGFKQYGKKHGYDVWLHTALTVANIENDPILRLTMLLHDTGKPSTHALDENGNSTFKNHAKEGGIIAEKILKRLHMSNEYIKTVSMLVSIHDWEIPESRVTVKRYLRVLGEKNFIRLMKIRKADKSALAKGFRDISDKLIFAFKEFDDIIEKNEPYRLSDLAVNGNDLLKITNAENIGRLLEELLTAVTVQPELNRKSTLMNMASDIISKA